MMILPAQPGTYAVCFRLARSQKLRVGRLGEFTFAAGDYVYVGSAFGPGGLRARLGRHLRDEKRVHWHIDALRAVAQVRGIFYTVGPRSFECDWSRVLSESTGAVIPVLKFGATDCRENCRAHLIAFSDEMDRNELREQLAKRAAVPVHVELFE